MKCALARRGVAPAVPQGRGGPRAAMGLERISKPPPEEAGAGEAEEAEKHLGLRLVAGDEPAAAHEPGEEPFDEPASFVAVAQLPAVLRLDGAGALVRGDHLDAALLQLSVERIAVVAAVADQCLRQRSSEASV